MRLIRNVLTRSGLLVPTGDIGNSGFYKPYKPDSDPCDISQEELETMRRNYDRFAKNY